MVRNTFVLVVCVLLAACGGGSHSAPTAPGSSTTATPNPCATSQGCPSIDSIGFWVRIQSNTSGNPGGPWSFTYLDKTYTGTGNAEYGFVNVAAADYQVSGQFSASAFTVSLGRQSGGRGGVPSASVQNLEGPLSPGGSAVCSVAYFSQAAIATPQTFRLKFAVMAGSGDTC